MRHTHGKLDVDVFDFDSLEQWDKVLSVVNDPFVLRALDAGMNARCSTLETKWDRSLGPWRFSDRNNSNWLLLCASPPSSNSPNWYRITGHCNAIAPWCAAVGSLLFPEHQWYYAHNGHVPNFVCHSAGIGFRKNERESLIIMDILFSPQTLREGSEWSLVRLLTGPQSQHVTLLEAIERLESGHHT